MGAPLILEDRCGLDEVSTSGRDDREAEYARVAVVDLETQRVAVLLDRMVRPSPSAPWRPLHAVRHELSPMQARRLAEMLLAAADRADGRSHD